MAPGIPGKLLEFKKFLPDLPGKLLENSIFPTYFWETPQLGHDPNAKCYQP